MNNILVDNIRIHNKNLFIDNQNISSIVASGVCEINIFNCNISNLEILVENNSSLVVNYFNKPKKLESLINIKVKKSSNLVFNHSFYNRDKYNLKILTDFLESDANISLKVNGVNDEGKSQIDVDGFVNESKIDNVLDENLRIYNINNGSCLTNPNMYIGTSKVMANHSASIGNVREDELFYLMGKGINYENATKLIIQGFLIRNFNNVELINKIKENI
jgi:hypothetical protein